MLNFHRRLKWPVAYQPCHMLTTPPDLKPCCKIEIELEVRQSEQSVCAQQSPGPGGPGCVRAVPELWCAGVRTHTHKGRPARGEGSEDLTHKTNEFCDGVCPLPPNSQDPAAALPQGVHLRVTCLPAIMPLFGGKELQNLSIGGISGCISRTAVSPLERYCDVCGLV